MSDYSGDIRDLAQIIGARPRRHLLAIVGEVVSVTGTSPNRVVTVSYSGGDPVRATWIDCVDAQIGAGLVGKSVLLIMSDRQPVITGRLVSG